MPTSRLLSLLLASLLLVPVLAADEVQETTSISMEQWLALGPVPVAKAAFSEDSDELINNLSLAATDLWPAEGRTAHFPPGQARIWQKRSTPLSMADGDGSQATWLATVLSNDRFLDATLKVKSAHPLKIWVDGAEVATKATSSEEPEETSASLSLDAGSHRVLVLAVRDDSAPVKSWALEAHFEVAPALADVVSFSDSPKRSVAIDDLLHPARARSVDVAPGGDFIAVTIRRPAAPSEGGESWIDILSPDGTVQRTLRQNPSSFAWSPAGDGSFVYLLSADGKQQIRRGHANSGGEQTIVRDLEDVSDLRFATAETAVLTITESPEADERGVKRFRDPMDRWSYRRDRSHYHLLGLDGSRQRLTASDPFDELQDVHPDGTHLLIARAHYAGARRPFRRTELIELEISTLKTHTVADLGWFNSATYAPDGRHALVLGSAALFDGAGSVLAEDRVVNDYDAQAYLLDLDNGDAEPLSRDFDPAIQNARWPSGDRVFLRVEDRSWARVVALDPQTKTFETLPSGVDVVHGFDVEGDRLAWVGSSMNGPPTVWTSTGGEPTELSDIAADRFADVHFGDVRDWSFTSKAGDEILGRVYLPPGVDEEAAAAYPLIVYYYGGTAPVGRAFGGRYPKELWAAQGFVVYVLQPSGTTGFGQEYAARHVNAWGRQTADEILEGTELFLKAHPFVNGERVGAIGASYGGFMTMYLQTRSDIFAAAVSHAGISNLTSYWGQGWWGYLYSDVASAGSFPWNNKELYVDQSPIYAADKITTPLLLLHGDADTNVPPVESHQMYTALEVLGKEVELIEIGGQNHTILSLEERRLWSRTIIAWFSRYLKNEGEMWDHLWGTEEEPKG